MIPDNDGEEFSLPDGFGITLLFILADILASTSFTGSRNMLVLSGNLSTGTFPCILEKNYAV